MAETITVEVVCATPDKQVLRALEVPPGTTAMEAIERSGIRDEFPDIEIRADAIGVFSRKVGPDHVLQPGDRVEIYRPLLADPKEMRRQRAKEQR